jgi:hypothetical protein
LRNIAIPFFFGNCSYKVHDNHLSYR